MRRRSYAAHADNFDDYFSISVQQGSEKDASILPIYQIASSNPDHDQAKVDTDANQRNAKKEVQKPDSDLWKEFDFKAKPSLQDLSELSEEISQASTDDLSSHCGSPLERRSADFGIKESVITSTLMAIGSQDANVPKFIADLFEDPQNGSNNAKASFDLIIKEHEFQGQQYKTKLWIQDTSEIRHQNIIDVYYKSINSYLFVYKNTSRESFNSLVKVIERIRGKVNESRFTGVLICINEENDAKEKVVSDEEAENLVSKFGLKSKLNMDMSVSEIKKEIVTTMKWKPAAPRDHGLTIQKCFT